MIALDSARGDPVAPSDSTTALSDILTNPDHSKCPSACLRPVGIAFEPTSGRLFMTGDSTGEIYVLMKASGTPTSTASGTIVTATGAPNSASMLWNKGTAVVGFSMVAFALAMVTA